MYKRKSSGFRLAGGHSKKPREATKLAVRAIMAANAPRARSSSSRLAPATKYFDTSQSLAVLANANWQGALVPCTNYITNAGDTLGAYTDSALIPSAVGAGYGEIVGTRYNIKKIRCRGQISYGPASDQADVIAGVNTRVCLVMDTQPNGAQAASEDVFQDLGSAQQCVFAYQNMGYKPGRFKILKDVILTSQVSASGTDGTNTNSMALQTVNYDFAWAPTKAQQVMIRGGNATPTISALQDLNVFLVAHAGVNTSAATLVGCARCYYVD